MVDVLSRKHVNLKNNLRYVCTEFRTKLSYSRKYALTSDSLSIPEQLTTGLTTVLFDLVVDEEVAL